MRLKRYRIRLALRLRGQLELLELLELQDDVAIELYVQAPQVSSIAEVS